VYKVATLTREVIAFDDNIPLAIIIHHWRQRHHAEISTPLGKFREIDHIARRPLAYDPAQEKESGAEVT